jgi:hypothetical protein
MVPLNTHRSSSRALLSLRHTAHVQGIVILLQAVPMAACLPTSRISFSFYGLSLMVQVCVAPNQHTLNGRNPFVVAVVVVVVVARLVCVKDMLPGAIA